MIPTFENDEYDDNYFDKLYERDDLVLTLGFEGIFSFYKIIQILFEKELFLFIVLLLFY